VWKALPSLPPPPPPQQQRQQASMRGYEADIRDLLSSFVSQHSDTASFEAFKRTWCASVYAHHRSAACTRC
jgi:hypothetical protein